MCACVSVWAIFFRSDCTTKRKAQIHMRLFLLAFVCVCVFFYVCLCPTENTDKTHGVSFGNWNSELGLSCSWLNNNCALPWVSLNEGTLFFFSLFFPRMKVALHGGANCHLNQVDFSNFFFCFGFMIDQYFGTLYLKQSRYQWSRVLRCRPLAAYLLGLRVRIPPGTWMTVYCKCVFR